MFDQEQQKKSKNINIVSNENGAELQIEIFLIIKEWNENLKPKRLKI